MEFVQRIASSYGVATSHPLVRYLNHKTKAVDRGSKARRSLGNLYALRVLAEDHLENRVSRFTDLLTRMRAMPFGAKLQNHPLDNRLNDEFARQMGVDGDLLPIRAGTIDGAKSRSLSEPLLAYKGSDPDAVAAFLVEAIDTYVELIKEKQLSILDEIESITDAKALRGFFEEAFAARADARLFEVASFVLLAEHFGRLCVWFGPTEKKVREEPLTLFKTGRTNANDGGIDFVLRPVGRFFQVTEELEFTKFFLDLDKVNRFPISFVIKSELSPDAALKKIAADAERAGKIQKVHIETYLALFEEVFTLPTLRAILDEIADAAYESMKADLILQIKLEYGLLD